MTVRILGPTTTATTPMTARRWGGNPGAAGRRQGQQCSPDWGARHENRGKTMRDSIVAFLLGVVAAMVVVFLIESIAMQQACRLAYRIAPTAADSARIEASSWTCRTPRARE